MTTGIYRRGLCAHSWRAVRFHEGTRRSSRRGPASARASEWDHVWDHSLGRGFFRRMTEKRTTLWVSELVGEKMEAPPGFEPGMEVLQTSALPLGDGAVRTGFSTKGRRWSGKRDSNPRLRPWQGRTLPLSYSRPLNLKTAYHAGGGPSKRAARRRHRYEPTTGITNPRRRRWSRPQIPAAHPASARRQHQSGTRRHPDGYGPDSPAPFA